MPKGLALLLVLCVFGCIAARADASPPSPLRGAHVGFYAVDVTTGAVLASQDADGAFIPASTLKLLTGSAALETLPPGFSFRTQILSDGKLTDGVLHGDLYVRGGGDPTFDVRTLDQAAVALAAQGVKSIEGTIQIDTSRYNGPRYPPGWDADDLAYDYAAPITAFSIDENAAHVVIAPGPTVGDPVRVVTSDGLNLAPSLVETGPRKSDDTSDIAIDWRSMQLRLIGSIPIDGGDSTLDAAAIHPLEVIGTRIASALDRAGISRLSGRFGTGAAPPGARALWTHRSAPMATLLANFWLPSDNFYGEMFVNEVGARSAGNGSTLDRGIAMEQAWFRSLGGDPSTLTVVDGSGLSSYDRVTPRALVTILTHDWNGAHRRIVMDALPIAGVSGTLAHHFGDSPLRSIMYAKTGSMNHTRTLAGYVVTPERTVAFALLLNDWMGTSEQALDELRARMIEGLLPAP